MSLKIILLAFPILGVVAAVLILYGESRWKARARAMGSRLDAARLPIEPKVFDIRELANLPAPVQRYFRAALFGLISMANLCDRTELARGALMRFFAEAAWYPTALLPSQGIHWKSKAPLYEPHR